MIRAFFIFLMLKNHSSIASIFPFTFSKQSLSSNISASTETFSIHSSKKIEHGYSGPTNIPIKYVGPTKSDKIQPYIASPSFVTMYLENKNNTQNIPLTSLDRARIYCRLVTPKPDSEIQTLQDFYGIWYVATKPGVKSGAPICERVEFIPGNTLYNFNKVLTTYSKKTGTFTTMYQNGTLIATGKIVLQVKLDNGHNKGKTSRYTIIGAEPNTYIIAYYCKHGKPTIAVLTRSQIPSMNMWADVFKTVQQTGFPKSVMNLHCRPVEFKQHLEYSQTSEKLDFTRKNVKFNVI